MRVSIYWLCQATEKHRGTVKKRVSALDADKHGRYDSAAALEAIYCGAGRGDNGQFISTPEAVRQLTIAKKEQIELQNQVTRGKFYPCEEVHFLYSHVFKIVAQTLKGNLNRHLSFETINDIFSQFREAGAKMLAQGDQLWMEYEKEIETKEGANGSDLSRGVPESDCKGNSENLSPAR